jgi:hypothetical protein
VTCAAIAMQAQLTAGSALLATHLTYTTEHAPTATSLVRAEAMTLVTAETDGALQMQAVRWLDDATVLVTCAAMMCHGLAS